MNAAELAALMRVHRLHRKLLPTRGSYGPTLSSRPPSKTLPDGTKVAVPPFWWCPTCAVEFPKDDTRDWSVLETEHQADVVLAAFAEVGR